MPGCRRARSWLRSYSRYVHKAHQPCTRLRLTTAPSPRNVRAIRREPRKRHAVNNSSIWRINIRSLSWAGRRRPVHVRTRHPEKLALPADRQRAVRTVEPGSSVRDAHFPDLLAKKSRSRSADRSWRTAYRSHDPCLPPCPGPHPHQRYAQPAPAAATSTRKPSWGEPRSAAPDPPRLPAPAPPPKRSSP